MNNGDKGNEADTTKPTFSREKRPRHADKWNDKRPTARPLIPHVAVQYTQRRMPKLLLLQRGTAR